MEKRIKEIRRKLGITQADFGKGISVSQNYVWMIEKGDRIPSDRTIADICRVYNVNENWLRTGEGEPFMQLSREDTIAAYVGKINGGKITDTEKCIIKFMAETPVEEWTELAATLRRFADEMKGGSGSG